MNIAKEEQHTLYKEWQSKRKYENFVYDGIINYEKWENAKPKILFLLKETTNDFKKISEQSIDIRKGSGNHFWWNICYWKYLITQLYYDRPTDFIEQHQLPEVKENNYILDSIAYVNVKKNCDNNNQSDDAEIFSYAKSDKDLLIRQLDLINPNIIICSNITFEAYKHLYNDNLTSINDFCFKHNSKLIIKFRHPGYFQIKGGKETLYSHLKNHLTVPDNILKKFNW
jgi:hypothetical protein